MDWRIVVQNPYFLVALLILLGCFFLVLAFFAIGVEPPYLSLPKTVSKLRNHAELTRFVPKIVLQDKSAPLALVHKIKRFFYRIIATEIKTHCSLLLITYNIVRA